MRLGNFGWKVDPARTLPPLPSLPRKAWERGFNPGLPLPTCPSLSSLGAQLLSKLSGHSFLWVIHFRDAPEASVGQSWAEMGAPRGHRKLPRLVGETDLTDLNTKGPCLPCSPLHLVL